MASCRKGSKEVDFLQQKFFFSALQSLRQGLSLTQCGCSLAPQDASMYPFQVLHHGSPSAHLDTQAPQPRGLDPAPLSETLLYYIVLRHSRIDTYCEEISHIQMDFPTTSCPSHSVL